MGRGQAAAQGKGRRASWMPPEVPFPRRCLTALWAVSLVAAEPQKLAPAVHSQHLPCPPVKLGLCTHRPVKPPVGKPHTHFGGASSICHPSAADGQAVSARNAWLRPLGPRRQDARTGRLVSCGDGWLVAVRAASPRCGIWGGFWGHRRRLLGPRAPRTHPQIQAPWGQAS